jgi:hypothetical protein
VLGGRDAGLVNWLGGHAPTPGEFARRITEPAGKDVR